MKNMYGGARVYNTVHIIIYYCIIVIIVLSTVHMGLVAHTLGGLYIILYIPIAHAVMDECHIFS